MRNLKYYRESAIEFHDKVVTRKSITKTDPGLKGRLSMIRSEIERQFQAFDSNFGINQLEQLISLTFEESKKIDLQKLYSYQSSVIQALKTQLTTTETNRIIATCQNCTLSEINSFDHILPKTEFAEFIVHPKNLFPSCTICNSLKSKSWTKDGYRTFLNLYLDQLPNEQFLFVAIEITTDVIETKFFLNNVTGIDISLFNIIESHYKNLELFKRFSDNSDMVISPLKNHIETYVSKISINEIIDLAKERIEKDRKAFGYNYWKSVLELALLENEHFVQKVVNGEL